MSMTASLSKRITADSSKYHVSISKNHYQHCNIRRELSGFSFAGPRNLNEIMKTELLENKTKAEISDIWMSYHESKERVHGTVLKGSDGLKVLQRAEKLPFFIEPIFRDDGFFMLLSQFQTPSHFLLAYLEDYKMDPNRAQPLLTFSIFNDMVESHDISLLRCDVINKGIEESEGRKVMEFLVDCYKVEEEHEKWVKEFNEKPATFDVDDYIACMNQKWKRDDDEHVDDSTK